ncbi:hypothetical protein [Halomonas kalidii]|uniref:Uncharacterized protein n=1 Tax=Halomonas kalidii TaxID=3043293 RepID=A0ABT6VQT7_9GAMM|nr:hypothetical protein [Halomonas kalidii]MDI5936358.1 hypothetical protein [Halomonas kalidii]
MLDVFELEDTSKLPILLLFTEVEGECLKIELNLDDSTQESAYRSLKEQLEFSCYSLALIKEENIKNPEGLFAGVSMNKDHRDQWNLFKKGVGIYSAIRSLLP